MDWSEGVDSIHLWVPSRKKVKKPAPPCDIAEESCVQSFTDVFASACACLVQELFMGRSGKVMQRAAMISPLSSTSENFNYLF